MSVIPNGFAECATHFRQTLDSEDYLCVTGHDLGVGPNDPTDVANAVFDSWQGGSWAPAISSQLTLTHVVSRVNRGSGIEIGISNRTPFAGSSSGVMAPQNVAYLMKKQTALGGRQGRGRMYLPGASEGNIESNGAVISAQIALLNTFGSDFLNTLAINDVAMVVLHTLAATPPTAVTSFVADTVVATQRRRLR